MRTQYFCYGSNMNIKRMNDRGIKPSSIESAILKNYKLVFNKIASGKIGESYANIVPEKGCIVEGVLYRISSEAIKILDKFEGHPKHYIRSDIQVIMKNGNNVTAITYIATQNKVKDGLLPGQEYMAHLLAGKDYLSEEYYKSLLLVETK